MTHNVISMNMINRAGSIHIHVQVATHLTENGNTDNVLKISLFTLKSLVNIVDILLFDFFNKVTCENLPCPFTAL